MQEIGRAGRDGQEAKAILYFNNEDIKGGHHRSAVTNNMKEYCLLTSCRRSYLCNMFAFEVNDLLKNERCCDICDNEISNYAYEDDAKESQLLNPLRQEIKNALNGYIEHANSNIRSAIALNYLSSLDENLADDIMDAFMSSPNVNVIDEKFGFLSSEHMVGIKNLLTMYISRM